MRKFFFKVFILFVLLVIGTGIIVFLPLPENSYYLAIVDKHRILAETQSPRIVLAGGSSLAFGVDSSGIQDRFHIPVVNTAVHAGFGLGRMLDDISRFLYPEDLLLIIPEYEQFTSTWNGDAAAYDLIFDVRQYRLLWSSYYDLPSSFFYYLLMYLKTIISGALNPFVYTRNGFNEYGDYVNHLGMANQPFSPSGNLGAINQSYLNNFFRLVDSFTERGITVMLSYPGFEEQSFLNSAALIQELDALFRAKENLHVISSPGSYCYPADYFYDTVYHLNMTGRMAHTSQLIRDLQTSGLLSVNE